MLALHAGLLCPAFAQIATSLGTIELTSQCSHAHPLVSVYAHVSYSISTRANLGSELPVKGIGVHVCNLLVMTS